MINYSFVINWRDASELGHVLIIGGTILRMITVFIRRLIKDQSSANELLVSVAYYNLVAILLQLPSCDDISHRLPGNHNIRHAMMRMSVAVR